MFSIWKVEKVVNPPINPVPKSNWVKLPTCADISKPIKKEPIEFMIKVETGKSIEKKRLNMLDKLQRESAPKEPPIKTIK